MTRLRWTTAVRLGIGLTGVTVTLVFAAALLGLAPGLPLAAFLALTGLGGYTLFLVTALRPPASAAAVPEHIRAAFDTLSEGFVLLDEQCRIVFANAAFARMLGTSADRLRHQDLSALSWHPVTAGDTPAEWPWATALCDGVARRGTTLCLTTASRGERVLAVNVVPIAHADDDRPRGVVVTCCDVTVPAWPDADSGPDRSAHEAHAPAWDRQPVGVVE